MGKTMTLCVSPILGSKSSSKYERGWMEMTWRYIFWLSGWAGTGKSTTARTIVREYYDNGYFITSFFFSGGGGGAGHAGKFVGTIASQLAQRCAAFKSFLVEAISSDEDFGNRIVKDQWNELVLQPLSKLGAGSFQAPLLIVTDAQDECEKESDVTSTSALETLLTLGPTPFPGIHHKEETIRHLVRKAGGLFIWAATACRFIDEGGSLFGPDRLLDILKGDSSDIGPEEELNNIYAEVLNKCLGARLKQHEKDKAYEMLREALGAINVDAMLGGFRSILDIPKDPIRPVRLHHPSLRDFLLSSQRCRDVRFWVDEKKAHKALANHCMQLMSQKLQRDIYSLEDPGARVAQVPPENLARCLPAEHQYACRYWVDHLQRSEYQFHNDGRVHFFLQDHLLHWVEALSWIEQSAEGIRAITSLQSMVNSNNNHNLHAFLHDAKRVLLYNRSIIEEAPLQTYFCALAFAPRKSLVRRKFQEEMVSWIKICPQIVEEWSALMQTLEGHTNWVRVITFSPYSKLVASASDDKTLRVWGTVTGTAKSILKSHTDRIRAIAFSPDGNLVVSASSDDTVRVWDAATGTAAHIFKNCFTSTLTFSKDGLYLRTDRGS
ncbi:MAG: hypothetical protein M1840_007242 [Geoglossum simile]|nr:MAG: hypothetical protein M1840_007242 [Geoglossum simile]